METKDYSRNAKEVWEEVKSIFSDNPEEALKQCSLDLKKNRKLRSKRRTLFVCWQLCDNQEMRESRT